MRRLWLIAAVLLWPVLALGQQLLTTSTNFIGTSQPLVLRTADFNEFNIQLAGNTPIKFALPIISNTMPFRVNLCETGAGGFTPTFSVVPTSVSLVNRVNATIQQTTAGYCETQNWTYRSKLNQLILENVSPPTGGGIPGVSITNQPSSTGQALVSTSTSTGSWQNLPNNLPPIPATGQALFSSTGTAVWSGFAAGSDVVMSSTNPGQVNVLNNKQTCSPPSPCAVTGTYVSCNATSPMTLNLPPAVAGKPLYLRSLPTSTAACTLQANGSDMINGSPTLVLPNSKQAVELMGDGAGAWGIINFSYPVPQTLAAHNFANGITGGVLSSARPACADLTGAAPSCGTNASELSSGTVPTAQLPNPIPASNIPAPTASTLGGVQSAAAQTHQWVNSIGTNGIPTLTQPLSTDLGDLPLGYGVGGTNCTSPGASCINGLGGAAKGNNTDINALNNLTTAIPVNEGGSGCGGIGSVFVANPVVANLPASPMVGTTCTVTDAQQLQLGTPVTGGGSIQGAVTWNGSQWKPGGNATAPPGSVVPLNGLPNQTGRYSAQSQPIGNLPAPALAGDALSEGAAIGVISPAAVNGTTFNDGTGPVSTAGLVNDNANSNTVSARNNENTGDIFEIGTHADDTVHIGGGAASTISLDDSSAVSQGQFSSGAYIDFPSNNTMWSGGTENCANSIHSYTVTANGVLTLACPSDTAIHRLFYRFYQPSGGSTFTYSLIAGNGASMDTAFGGTLPTPCAVNGCYDEIEVDWESSRNIYHVTYIGTYLAQGIVAPTCPSGNTCYYVDSVGGLDTNNGTSTSTPFQTISKANSMVSSLNPGDKILFKAGSTWLGSNSLNGPFLLGDTAAHNLKSATYSAIGLNTAIEIGTYGGSGRAIFDMQNNQAECFGVLNPNNGNPPVPGAGTGVKWITIHNFACLHALGRAVIMDPPAASAGVGTMPGMTVGNMYLVDNGAGCSTTGSAPAGAACLAATPILNSGHDSAPVDWQATHAYTANSPSNYDVIVPCLPSGGNCTVNPGTYWYYETVSSCTSAGSFVTGAFPQNVPPGTLGSLDGTCQWAYGGVKGVGYNNQLQYFDSCGGGRGNNNSNCTGDTASTGNNIHFLNNIVKWNGGHNEIEVDGDGQGGVVQGNVVGPTCNHQCIDSKMSGDYNASPATVTQILGNYSGCGLSQSLCACQTLGDCASGGASSGTYLQQSFTTSAQNALIQSNVFADGGNGVQITPSANTDDCGTSTNTCPLHANVYNNTIYQPATSTTGIFAGAGNGRFANSVIRFENNIIDGPATLFNVGTGTTHWTTAVEDYNDLGGAQGYTNAYSFNGSGTHGTHDLVCQSSCSGSGADPKYTCESQGAACGPQTSSYTPQTGSPVINAGLAGLTPGNSNMGAF